jgi:hypothetical protein
MFSAWVGIDGLSDGTVEQDGIDASCSAGTTAYDAWYELFPAYPVYWQLAVHAGDTITATVSSTGTPGAYSYELALTDTTDNQQASATAPLPEAQNASAECIVEDPEYGDGALIPFASFTPVQFSSCQADNQSIGNYAPQAIDIVDGSPEALTSPLSPASSFSVSRVGAPLAGPVVGLAAMPSGLGYWLVNASGQVSPHGSAVDYGGMGSARLNSPIAHIIATPDGQGYWEVAGDGGVFCFGDAQFYGSMGASHLNAPVTSLAPTPDGKGYWLVATDGGIFSFGAAQFYGSMGGSHLNKPVVGIAGNQLTGGYWEVASDGGIFSFAAPFYGSMGATVLNKPIIGMTATADAAGYRFVASDGGIFSFGDAQFHGSLGGVAGVHVVGLAADNATGGYWLVDGNGTITPFGAPTYGSD